MRDIICYMLYPKFRDFPCHWCYLHKPLHFNVFNFSREGKKFPQILLCCTWRDVAHFHRFHLLNKHFTNTLPIWTVKVKKFLRLPSHHINISINSTVFHVFWLQWLISGGNDEKNMHHTHTSSSCFLFSIACPQIF